MMRMAIAALLGASVSAQGNKPEWRYYTVAGCPAGAEATMANTNALADIGALRAASTGFFVEPTSTQDSHLDGSQLRLCGEQGFLFDGAFSGLCDAPDFDDGQICLRIPATSDLFGGGHPALGGYWAKLACVSDCPPESPPTTTVDDTPIPRQVTTTAAPATAAPTTASPTASAPPPSDAAAAPGWACESAAACAEHFGELATTTSGVSCCGPTDHWYLSCYVCLAESAGANKLGPADEGKEGKAKKSKSKGKKRARRHPKSPKANGKKGSYSDADPFDRVDPSGSGSGDAPNDRLDNDPLEPKTPKTPKTPKDDPGDRLASFSADQVCSNHEECALWHGADSECCFSDALCRSCDEAGASTAAVGTGPPQCWDETALATFLDLEPATIAAARDFATTCTAMLDGWADTEACCGDPTSCEVCVSANYVAGKHAAKVTAKSTQGRAGTPYVAIGGGILVAALAMSVWKFGGSAAIGDGLRNARRTAVARKPERVGLLVRSDSNLGDLEGTLVDYGATGVAV
mmetsp:Transcript_21195/g.55245  ORF Transcript_21195/g.55245 Transcript_21195/m.55245 type:complete len:520 (-) Transcript_21195:264-1823(-)